MQISPNSEYQNLIEQIGDLLHKGREQAAKAVNTLLVQTYWQIGRYIVDFEQGGKAKAEYGSELLEKLSKDLTLAYGKGFSRSNLTYMRKFYLSFPKSETLSHKLSWSHHFEILKAEDKLEINFYTKQCEKDNWSVRELKRQMNLYLNYFRKEENTEGDNEPIGIVLGAYKDQILIEYATENISNQLFVSKYQLYLPDKQKLAAELNKLLENQNDE